MAKDKWETDPDWKPLRWTAGMGLELVNGQKLNIVLELTEEELAKVDVTDCQILLKDWASESWQEAQEGAAGAERPSPKEQDNDTGC